MIYAFQQRGLPNPMLDVLNGPSFNESTPTRDATTIPTQAFAMLNSSFGTTGHWLLRTPPKAWIASFFLPWAVTRGQGIQPHG